VFERRFIACKWRSVTLDAPQRSSTFTAETVGRIVRSIAGCTHLL
jgi:hypothetical protein